jgi:hypothetical protein
MTASGRQTPLLPWEPAGWLLTEVWLGENRHVCEGSRSLQVEKSV